MPSSFPTPCADAATTLETDADAAKDPQGGMCSLIARAQGRRIEDTGAFWNESRADRRISLGKRAFSAGVIRESSEDTQDSFGEAPITRKSRPLTTDWFRSTTTDWYSSDGVRAYQDRRPQEEEEDEEEEVSAAKEIGANVKDRFQVIGHLDNIGEDDIAPAEIRSNNYNRTMSLRKMADLRTQRRRRSTQRAFGTGISRSTVIRPCVSEITHMYVGCHGSSQRASTRANEVKQQVEAVMNHPSCPSRSSSPPGGQANACSESMGSTSQRNSSFMSSSGSRGLMELTGSQTVAVPPNPRSSSTLGNQTHRHAEGENSCVRQSLGRQPHKKRGSIARGSIARGSIVSLDAQSCSGGSVGLEEVRSSPSLPARGGTLASIKHKTPLEKRLQSLKQSTQTFLKSREDNAWRFSKYIGTPQEKEARDFDDHFKIYDTENTGKLTQQQVCRLLSDLGLQPRTRREKEACAAILGHLWSSACAAFMTGACYDFNTVLSHVSKLRTAFNEILNCELRQHFNEYDLDKNGLLDVNEAVNVLKVFGLYPLDERERREVLRSIRKIDKDGNGSIDFQEFHELAMCVRTYLEVMRRDAQRRLKVSLELSDDVFEEVRDDLIRLTECFKAHDEDSNDHLNGDEVNAALKDLGIWSLNRWERAAILEEMDLCAGDEVWLDLHGFIQAVVHFRRCLSKHRAHRLFQMFHSFDCDGDGEIELWEVARNLHRLGLEARNIEEQAEIAQLMEDVDCDGSGTLDFEEFSVLAEQAYERLQAMRGAREWFLAVSLGYDRKQFIALRWAYDKINEEGAEGLDVDGFRHAVHCITNTSKVNSEALRKLFRTLATIDYAQEVMCDNPQEMKPLVTFESFLKLVRAFELNEICWERGEPIADSTVFYPKLEDMPDFKDSKEKDRTSNDDIRLSASNGASRDFTDKDWRQNMTARRLASRIHDGSGIGMSAEKRAALLDPEESGKASLEMTIISGDRPLPSSGNSSPTKRSSGTSWQPPPASIRSSESASVRRSVREQIKFFGPCRESTKAVKCRSSVGSAGTPRACASQELRSMFGDMSK